MGDAHRGSPDGCILSMYTRYSAEPQPDSGRAARRVRGYVARPAQGPGGAARTSPHPRRGGAADHAAVEHVPHSTFGPAVSWTLPQSANVGMPWSMWMSGSGGSSVVPSVSWTYFCWSITSTPVFGTHWLSLGSTS